MNLLLDGGSPPSFETELWDFKRKAPELPKKSTQSEKDAHSLEVMELIKDIVAFHNSYGGYIVFGIEDKGSERVAGCSNVIDCGDIKQRIRAHTDGQVEIYFELIDAESTCVGKPLGLLLVTRRRRGDPPVKFTKNPKQKPDGSRAFTRDSVYVRIGDKCLPASTSAEAWEFLFSDRLLSAAPLEKIRDLTPSNLPPRDPDMIQFVGREQELSDLREWTLDERSPVRLLTGIGGLGKTSIAYRYCEELAKTGAGNFDLIVWVSAKRETYAALRGKLVKTTRHDFSDIDELLRKLISLIAGETYLEDDMDREELIDQLVEICEYSSNFVVVDDLDSLPPEDQRECATILQQIAFRTVDRDQSASKFLMTSRLDQGLSPTNVKAVTGLPLGPFEEHVNNLCVQFELPALNRREIKSIHRSSSGSPLFASSIVRLMHLGEGLKDSCTRWEGEDGEDVRDAAFRRELERLSIRSALVLLAVITLGQTSITELEDATELTRRKILDHVSDLQSFHLLAKSENRLKETIFSASKELISSVRILRRHVGKQAKDVEIRCARIRNSQDGQSREIGVAISQIVGLWREDRPDEALVVARDLFDAYQKNGDVCCVLSGAYLKVFPKNYQDAEKYAVQAEDFGCKRQELFKFYVEAKIGVEDWLGLFNFSERRALRPSRNDDEVLAAYILSAEKLMKQTSDRGQPGEAFQYAVSAIERIHNKIISRALNEDYFRSLTRKQSFFAGECLRHAMKHFSRAGDKLSVSDLGFRIFFMNVRGRSVVEAICRSLREWLDDVEKRPVLDLAALDILADRISKLERIKSILEERSGGMESEIQKVSTTVSELSYRGGELRRTA